MKKATLKGYHSPDIIDFTNYYPEEPDSFGFLLEISVGIESEEGEDIFEIIICTPKWLLKKYQAEDIIFGWHHIIVFDYNLEKIISRIKSFCESCYGQNWDEIAEKVGRLGKWEFEDYTEKK